MQVSRRDALRLGAFGMLGAAGLAVPIGAGSQAAGVSTLAPANTPTPYATKFIRPSVLPYQLREDADGLFKLFTVTEQLGSANIVPGLQTPVYGYNGLVPGPIVKVEQGMRVKLRVRNQLPATHPKFGHEFNTSTHLHGSASLPQYDGYADDVTHPLDYKDYIYPNWQPARTLWYHDHNVHTTAENAYSGLAAQYHMSDPAEQALLPQGDYDVPMTITDAMFAADGSMAYDDRNHSGLMGDVILVNGKPWPVMQVKPKIYRFRVLNASISRSVQLRLSRPDMPMVMVATDGGLMPQARPVLSYRHAGAERYEFLVDFRGLAAGTNVDLLNDSNKNNVDYDNTNKVMRFQVVSESSLPPDSPGSRTLSEMPVTLVTSEAMNLKASQVTGGLFLRLERDDVTNLFQINGRSWHEVEDSGYKDVLTTVEPDEVQEWEIENRSGGGWFHPLHIHLVDFQIVSRNGLPAFDYELGPKDVMYVAEGETVKVRMKFTLQKGGGTSRNAGGRYMVHCHNLPHEDHDMMHQFAVGDIDVNDPIKSAPCRLDDGNYDDGWAPRTAPGAPTIMSATPGDASATVTWLPPGHDGGSPITGYSVRAMDAAMNTVGTLRPAAADATSLVVTGLVNGRPYWFEMTAKNAIGTSSASAMSAAVIPVAAAPPNPAPTVVATTPLTGATAVPARDNITATFSEPVGGVNATTFRLLGPTGTPVSALVTYNATTRVATLNPDVNLAAGTTYTAELGVAPGVKDTQGAALVPITWSFTTLAPVNTPPVVSARTPGINATGVSITGNVTVTFSEVVSGVSPTTFQLKTSAGAPIAAAVTQDLSNARKWILNPTANLARRTTYTASLTGGADAIRDSGGAPLASTSWNFTTG